MKIIIYFLSLLLVGCSGASNSVLDELPLSGLHYENNLFYSCSDDGDVLKIEFDSREILKRNNIGSYDLEGITANENSIFVIDEISYKILELDKNALEIINEYELVSDFDTSNSDGFEGLTFYEEDDEFLYFFAAHQTKPAFVCILKVNRSSKEYEILNITNINRDDLSACFYEKDSLYVISDSMRKLIKMDVEFNILEERNFLAIQAEGLAKVGNKFYFSSDNGDIFELNFI